MYSIFRLLRSLRNDPFRGRIMNISSLPKYHDIPCWTRCNVITIRCLDYQRDCGPQVFHRFRMLRAQFKTPVLTVTMSCSSRTGDTSVHALIPVIPFLTVTPLPLLADRVITASLLGLHLWSPHEDVLRVGRYNQFSGNILRKFGRPH